jgi:hypothetical protein
MTLPEDLDLTLDAELEQDAEAPAEEPSEPVTSSLSPVDLTLRFEKHLDALGYDIIFGVGLTVEEVGAYLEANADAIEQLHTDTQLYLDLMTKSAPKDPHIAPMKARQKLLFDIQMAASQSD